MYLNLRRQPGYRPVSSKVGDHLRILFGVVVHSFFPCAKTTSCDFEESDETTDFSRPVVD